MRPAGRACLTALPPFCVSVCVWGLCSSFLALISASSNPGRFPTQKYSKICKHHALHNNIPGKKNVGYTFDYQSASFRIACVIFNEAKTRKKLLGECLLCLFFLACIGSQYASPGSLGGSKCIDPHVWMHLNVAGQAIKPTTRQTQERNTEDEFVATWALLYSHRANESEYIQTWCAPRF